MKKYVLLAAAMSAALMITGCGKKEMPQKYQQLLADKSGSYVKLGFYGAPEQIDPVKAPEYNHDQMFSNLVFAAPLRKLQDGSYSPYLFESFETSLDGEQVVVNAKWRQNLKWHDGKDFDPTEFDYTVAQMLSAEKNSPYAAAAKGIVSMNNTMEGVEIRFAGNSVKYMDMLCVGLIPGHILDEKNIASGTTVKATYDSFMEKPVGLGPYKVVENEKHKYYQLEPDVNFFDGKGASRPKLVIASSYELQQSISDFREGLFDWIDIPSIVGEQLQNLGVENVIYMQYPNPAVAAWVFNTKNEKLQDIRIRKALNLIMDRSCVKQYLGPDSTELFDNLIPVGGEDKTLENAYEEGVKLLTEAGVVDNNNDGIREYNGSAFKLKIMINDDNMTRRMIAEKMIDKLKEAGIAAEVEAVSWTDFVAGRLKAGNYDTALLSYHIADNCSLKALFSTKQPDDAESLNFTGISDAELDADLAALDRIVCNEDKAVIYERVNKKISQLCPCAFLVRPSNLALVHGDNIATMKAKTAYWNDIFNWKLMFGPQDSKL